MQSRQPNGSGISAANTGSLRREYAERLNQQGGCCAICGATAESIGQTLAVDHDHETGAVRGLLCAMCNRMLGCAKDRPEVLRAGADYLINAEAAKVFIESVMDCIAT